MRSTRAILLLVVLGVLLLVVLTVRADAQNTYLPAVVSWYAEHGPGACEITPDVQNGLRFASRTLPCGTRVEFCHGSRCRIAIMSDRGPFVYDRTFDLNFNLRHALSCSDLCHLKWRFVRG